MGKKHRKTPSIHRKKPETKIAEQEAHGKVIFCEEKKERKIL